MTTPRTILHVDMDAFYVSVELRRRPELRGRPVVVGGDAQRGVVAAASYEARAHGVHSAMSSAEARRRCPRAVFLPGDHELYGRVSAEVHERLAQVTPVVEPIALDEAFLDVTGSVRRLGPGTGIAHELRRRIRAELDLGCSVGVATSKLIAKLASEAAKPAPGFDGPVDGAGVVTVRPGEETGFLHPHPVEALWGVGPATLARLRALGVTTVGDLAAVPVEALVASLGESHGRHLHALAHARDERPVESEREAKSIGHEETFRHDHHELVTLDPELVRMTDGVVARLRHHGLAARSVHVKVKFSDFRLVTRSATLPERVDSVSELIEVARELLAGVDPTPGVRLLGVSVGQLGPPSHRQLRFDDLLRPDRTELDATVDQVRDRFGAAAVRPASARGGRAPGASPWGPSGPDDGSGARRKPSSRPTGSR